MAGSPMAIHALTNFDRSCPDDPRNVISSLCISGGRIMDIRPGSSAPPSAKRGERGSRGVDLVNTPHKRAHRDGAGLAAIFLSRTLRMATPSLGFRNLLDTVGCQFPGVHRRVLLDDSGDLDRSAWSAWRAQLFRHAQFFQPVGYVIGHVAISKVHAKRITFESQQQRARRQAHVLQGQIRHKGRLTGGWNHSKHRMRFHFVPSCALIGTTSNRGQGAICQDFLQRR